ncbi:UPF0481 protein At3g47200-like [Miscanthus floridulus]|uniref:UPF0481 protein At3g47200-like n=1 Tax=Miscanthus floridulus TaxID=154761 RepID=UPI00345AC6E4
MATETESFVTAPSTPEAAPMAPTVEPASHQPADRLEIVVERRLRQHGEGESRRMTIFRVPAHVRDASKELYEPRLVSIGPYYRGWEALRAMEQHKWRYMRELMGRPPQPAASLGDYVRAVRDVEQEARRCYSERTSIFDAAQSEPPGGGEIEEEQSRHDGDPGGPGPDSFAEMLMLDGCFILEFFAKWYKGEPDKLCDVAWVLPLLHSDLLLLENQIPFFILEALFHVVSPTATKLDLIKLILHRLKFSSYELSTAEELVQSDIQHLLHLFYEAIMPRDDETASVQDSTPPSLQYFVQLRQMGVRLKKAVSTRFVFIRDMPRVPHWMKTTLPATLLRKVGAWFSKLLAMIRRTPPASAPTLVVPSVTQLREAGVRFEKKESPRHMFDIAFDRDSGVLEMPRMEVDYANVALLVNLVAFEQTRGLPGDGDTSRRLSSYAALVGALVRTGKDVEHLQKRGIVENLLDGDDDAATKFFQHLGDCSTLNYKSHMFAGMFEDLRQFYHSSWRRHKAKFLRDHCNSPWAVLALVVAISAFCFALFKLSTTIFSLAHPYYCHC